MQVDIEMKLAKSGVKMTGKRMSSCILLDIYPTSPLAKNKEKIPWAFGGISCEEEPIQQSRFKSLVEGGEILNSIRNRRGKRDKPYFLSQQVHLAVKNPLCLLIQPWGHNSQQLTTVNLVLNCEQKNGWIFKFLECHIIRSDIWQIVWTCVFSWKALLLACNILRAAEWRVD